MKITKTITCQLSIGEPTEGHRIDFQADTESDICALMMTLQILEHSREGMKEAKKMKGSNKKEISKQINMLSKLISYQNSLAAQLCDNYEYLKASADMHEKKLAITK